MKNFKTLLLLFICLPFFGLSTKINGFTAKGFKGKKVNLIEYTDFITKKYKILKTEIIDENGKFTFDVNIKTTQEAIIQIEYLIGIIYLDPNQEYTIYFPPFSENGEYTLTRNYSAIKFKTIPKNDINELVIRFDMKYDKFLEFYTIPKNHGLIGGKNYHKKLDVFKKQTMKDFKDIKNSYFSTYVKSNLAELELISSSQTKKISKLNVYNNFIVNRKINFNSGAQIRFIKKFYEKSFLDPGKVSTEISNAINKYASLSKLEAALKKDYYFKMEIIRQLAIVDNLYYLFYNKNYNQNNILKIINKLRLSSKFKGIREISKNVISDLTKMKKGTKAIDFELLSNKGNKVSLSSFRGKYVYLNFWAVWNKDSQKEMNLYPDFIEKYGENIEFLSINIDDKKKKFDTFLATHPKYKWTMLHHGGNANLLDEYDVVSLPKYILIDPKGNIVQNPASRPSPNGNYVSIDKVFFDIKKKNTKKEKFTVGGK